MKYQPVAKIVYQSDTILQYKIASKNSKKGGHHLVKFTTDGKRYCACVGHEWLQKKVDDILKDCRHKKLVTIYTTPSGESTRIQFLKEAIKILRNKDKDITAAWGNIFCQKPEHYNPSALYCTGCPISPEICNIHKIKLNGKRNKLPLIWKLQGQIYAGKRTAAAKTLREIIKEMSK